METVVTTQSKVNAPLNGNTVEEWTGKCSVVNKFLDNKPAIHQVNLSDLERIIRSPSRRPKKDGPAIIACDFRKSKNPSNGKEAYWRIDDCANYACFLAIDIDKYSGDVQEFLEDLPWAWMSWTTWSHGKPEKGNCFRVIFPMTHALDRSHFDALWGWFESYIDVDIDKKCKNIGHIYYTMRAKNSQTAVIPSFKKDLTKPLLNPFNLPNGYDIVDAANIKRIAEREAVEYAKTLPIVSHDDEDVVRYMTAALNNSAERVASAPVDSRNDTLNREAYKMFQYAAGGFFTETEVYNAFQSAGLAAGLNDREVNSTLRSARKGGLKKPISNLPKSYRGRKEMNFDDFVGQKQKKKPKYMPDVNLKRRLTAIWAGLGAGKTTQAARWRAYAESFLYVTARVSLTHNAASRLNLAHYQEEDGKAEDYLAICINSVHMIHPPKDGFEVVVLDELEQIIAQMHSSITKQPAEIYKKLKHILKSAKHVVVMDAHLSRQCLLTIFEIMDLGDEEDYDKIKFEGNQIFEEVRRYPEEQTLTHKITEMAMEGQTGAIACTAASDAKALTEILCGLGKRVLLYHRDVDESVKETLGTVNETWSNYDWVVYSPTVSSGVSYDLPDKFQNVILFARSISGITFTDLLQQAHRVRKPGSKILHAWVETKEYYEETDFEKICQHDHNKIEWSRMICPHTHLFVKIAGEFARSRYRTTQILRRRGNHVQRDFYRHWLQCKVSIVNEKGLPADKVKSMKTQMKEIKDHIKDDSLSAIMDADLLKQEELSFMKEVAQTMDEKRSVIKSDTLEFFGDVNEDLIDKSKSEVVRLVNLGLWETGHLKILGRRDAHMLSSGHPVLCKHEMAQIQTVAYLLHVAGVHIPDLLGGLINGFPLSYSGDTPLEVEEDYKYAKVHYDGDTRVFEWTSEHLKQCGFVDSVFEINGVLPLKERLDGWGVRVKKNFSKSPAPLLGDMLKAMGISTSSRKVSVDGKQIRFYRIDMESVEVQVKHSMRHNLKRRGLPVEAVLPSDYSETIISNDIEEELDMGQGNWPSFGNVIHLFDVVKQASFEWRSENPGKKEPHGEDHLYGKIRNKLDQQNSPHNFNDKNPFDFDMEGYFDEEKAVE